MSQPKKQKKAYLIIAHGSRDAESNSAFLEVLRELRQSNPEKYIQEAFLELATPLIPEAIDLCAVAQCTTIFAIPMMLFPGRHVKEDIPRMIQEAKEKYPELDFHYSGPLSSFAPLSKWLDQALQMEPLS